jgi:hypothetical protein
MMHTLFVFQVVLCALNLILACVNFLLAAEMEDIKRGRKFIKWGITHGALAIVVKALTP